MYDKNKKHASTVVCHNLDVFQFLVVVEATG